STVRSASFNIDGQEVLLPTVSDDGRIMTNDEAIAQYKKTGQHLGKFATPEEATAYAEQLHNDQAVQISQDDAFVVDTTEPPAKPPEVATRDAVNGNPSFADQVRMGAADWADAQKGKAEIALSIGASTVGWTLGAVNATIGTVKNLADYVVSGANYLGAK